MTGYNVRRILLGGGSFLITLASPLLADSGTWLGTNDATWAGANWTASPVPGVADTATFDGAGNGNTTIDLGAGVTVNTIVFDTSLAAAYTIGSGVVGSQSLTLSNGGSIGVNAGVISNQLFNAAIVLGDDGSAQTNMFTNNSTTTLTFAAGISGSSGAELKTLSMTGSGNTAISGVISSGTGGTVALSKSGGGTLTISGAAKTYSGGTSILEGVLSISAANHLGTGTILLDGGTLRSTAAANLDINTATAMTIGATGGTINSVHSAGTFRFQTANSLLGSGALTITGSGTLPLAGTPFAGVVVLNAANTYSGNVSVKNGGLLEVANAGGLGAGATVTVGDKGGLSVANLNFARNVTVNSGGTLLFQNGNGGIFSGAITLNGATTIRMQDWYSSTLRNGAITSTISGAQQITVDSGTNLGTGGTLTFSGFDAKASAATIVLNAASLAVNSNSGTAAASVVRADSLLINSGNLTIAGVASQDTEDVFGTLNLGGGSAGPLSGYSTFILQPNAATSTRLTFTNMGTRTAGTWVAINGTVGATPGAGAASVFFTNGLSGANLIGAGGSLASGTASVIPWLHDTSGGAMYGYDPTVGVAPISNVAVDLNSATSGQNVNDGNGATLTADRTINALFAGFSSFNLGGNTLTVTSGVITADNANFTNGTLDFGSAEGQIQVHQARQMNIDVPIIGSGGLTFIGFRPTGSSPGRLRLGGANTYTGTTNFYGYGAGTAEVYLTHSLALQNTTLNHVAGRGYNLFFGNGGTSGQTAYTFGGLSGNVNLNLVNNNTTAASIILTIGGNGQSTTYSGAISSSIAGGSIIKTGAGILSLGGANSYNGTTAVDGGTLLVNGAHTQAGDYTVNTGGTLGGAGSITMGAGGSLTVNAGGKLAPGAGIGTLTMSLGGGVLDVSAAVAVSASKAMVFELGTPTGSDKIVLGPSTALSIGVGGLEFDDFQFSNAGGLAVGTYTLVDADTPIVGTLGSNLGGTIGAATASIGVADGGNDLVLNVTSVPEPSSLGLLAIGAARLFGRRRRSDN